MYRVFVVKSSNFFGIPLSGTGLVLAHSGFGVFRSRDLGAWAQVSLLLGTYSLKAFDFAKEQDAKEGLSKKLTDQIKDG